MLCRNNKYTDPVRSSDKKRRFNKIVFDFSENKCPAHQPMERITA